jgi:hypothetical protein
MAPTLGLIAAQRGLRSASSHKICRGPAVSGRNKEKVMGRYKLIVLSNAVPGREDEYNKWYTNEHLGDVVSIPGFAAAQRFRQHSLVTGKMAKQYLAIYEMDAESPEAAVAALSAQRASGAMQISDAMDQDIDCAVFEVCSPQVSAPEEETAASA